MNLISLMCLCSLSPESLLLFNGVLQSYLIPPPPPQLSPSMLLMQTPNNTYTLQPVGKKYEKKKDCTPCLSDLCYQGENRPWQKYSEDRYYCFSHLKFCPWLSLCLCIDPVLQPFHSKCFRLISAAPTSSVSYSNQRGWLPVWQLTPSIN